MKKKNFELLFSLLFFLEVAGALFLPIYSAAEATHPFFSYVALEGADLLSLGAGIVLFLLLAASLFKAVFALRHGQEDEKSEQVHFVLYCLWIILGLGYAVITFIGGSLFAFGYAIGLSLSGLLAFFLDFHFYGQD